MARETLEQVYPKAQSENRELSAVSGTVAGFAAGAVVVGVLNYCSSEKGKKNLEKVADKLPDLMDTVNKFAPPPTAPSQAPPVYDYAWAASAANNSKEVYLENSNKLMGNAANNFPLLEG